MPTIAGVKFLIDSSFVTTANGSSNNISRPYIVNGQNFEQVHDIELALEQLFAAGSPTADLLKGLGGKTIYVTKNVFRALQAGNAAFLSPSTVLNPAVAGSVTGKTFVDQVPHLEQVTTVDSTGVSHTSVVIHSYPTIPYNPVGAFGYLDMRTERRFQCRRNGIPGH